MSTSRLLCASWLSLLVACAPPRATSAPLPVAAHDDVSTPVEPGRIAREALRADIDQLARLLIDSHPNPFAAEGEQAFRARVAATLQAIPAAGMTPRAFLRLARPLVASLRDGHTSIRSAPSGEQPRQVRLLTDIVDERTYVSGVFDETQRWALGGLIESVEDLAFPELVTRTSRMRGAENPYNNLMHLGAILADAALLEDLLALERPLSTVRVQVLTTDGTRRELRVEVRPESDTTPILPASTLPKIQENAAKMGWGWAPAQSQTAILRIGSMAHYREAFEIWRAAGYQRQLGAYLDSVAGGATTDSIARKIARVPSATELLEQLFSALQKQKATTLVVDLRGNSGGSSAMDVILGHFLWSHAELLESDDGYQVPRLSALYFANYGATSLEQVRAESGRPSFQLGDYDEREQKAWEARRARGLDAAERTRREQALATQIARMPSFARVWNAPEPKPRWKGKLVVVTSASTYSAGFDLLLLLRRHGARVVGVPSAQSANCFIDSLPYVLAHSKLTGSIAFKRSLALPLDPVAGKLLRPDRELSLRELSAMGFDPNAGLRLALER